MSVIPVLSAVRIRPLSNKEESEGCQEVVQVINGRPQINLATLNKAFTFDYAFPANESQEGVYGACVVQLTSKLFEGYNATVLAYGQTGSGKTHSMGTSYKKGETPEELAGIIPRAVGDIFKEIEGRKEEMTVGVSVSFVELYREQVYDLLSTKSAKKEDCVCDLREDPVKGVVIPNLTENRVSSVASTMAQLEAGSAKRVTAATAMNNTSSRSHAIFTVYLAMDKNNGETHLSKFHLVDLAGSERAKKTKATGERYKEGVSINQGLLALGNVISALGEDAQAGRSTHIPYRNSKLTRLLQDSLGGNSHTLMVSCVSPADSNIEETLSTLRYSDRARKIKNKPIVNATSNDAEVLRLKMENQELKLQLLQAETNGGGRAVVNTELNEKTKEENRALTTALMAAQEELAHMNEKVLLHEASNEKLKTKLSEVVAELDCLIENADDKELLTVFKKKLTNVVEAQEEAEKTVMEHDVTRADQSRVGADDNQEGQYEAEHALKRNAFTDELQKLNTVLAQKEKLASAMFANDAKMQGMKEKYEESLKTLENDINKLSKEKDELHQQQKSTPSTEPTNKISEQRRKRIQELEQLISDLKRKVMEQQKAIKVNEKNEAQVKKLAEEIKLLKQAKVKLIRQFKEDAEKLRAYKQQKEKEVQKLKQTERKQQAKIVKMENLHTKQQTVLRRKMEEAANINKRLKEVLLKQKANQSKFGSGRGGMSGAGERVRNWINEEMEVIVSVKEAANSREQLIGDRKTLTKELNEMKKGLRDTMNAEQMDEHQKKMKDLQKDLDMRNAQISQLQKQITDLEQDGTKNRFDSVKTMTEAKIALEHLFDKSVEQTMFQANIKSEFEELRQLYNEAVKNTNNLENEIAGLKNDHESAMLRRSREHEEKVLCLLNQMSGHTKSGDVVVPEDEIKKYSKLNEELMKLSEQNEQLRQQMVEEQKTKKTAEANKKLKKEKAEDRYTADEFFEESEDEDMEDDSDDDGGDSDPDWVKTPLFKRIRKIRETESFLAPGGHKPSLKRPNSHEEEAPAPSAKRFSGNSTVTEKGCKCKTDCRTKRCNCRKNGPVCTDSCGCDSSQCRNREEEGDRSALSDISNNDTANTMSLLNDTYQVASLKPGNTSRRSDEDMLRSPRKPPSSSPEKKKDLFASPMSPPLL